MDLEDRPSHSRFNSLFEMPVSGVEAVDDDEIRDVVFQFSI